MIKKLERICSRRLNYNDYNAYIKVPAQTQNPFSMALLMEQDHFSGIPHINLKGLG